MADKKNKYIPVMTERGVARYPKLSKPDTGGEYSDGKHKTEFYYESEAHTKAMRKQIEDYAKATFGSLKGVLLPIAEKDDLVIFKWKSPKKKPVLTDARNKAIPSNIEIGGGSIIRIAGVLASWEKGSKKGVSLWPDAVRVIKLSQRTPAFGAEEDGFDVDDYDGPSSDDDNTNDSDAGESTAGDLDL